MSTARTKVVVRKLPPGLTLEGFKAAVDKVAEGTYSWLSYHQGKVSARKVVFSRAYLNFSEPQHVLAFKVAFDGHLFVTTKGNQYRCMVEYAPYQKVPQPATKKNPLEGTIEQDPDYQAFLKELQEGPALLPSAAIQREQQDKQREAAGGAANGAAVMNPLMDFLKEKHAAGSGPGRKGPRDKDRDKEKKGDGRTVSARPADAKEAANIAAKAAENALAKSDATKSVKDRSGRDRDKDKESKAGTSRQTATPATTAPASKASQKTLLTRPKDSSTGPAPAPAASNSAQRASSGRSGAPAPTKLATKAAAPLTDTGKSVADEAAAAASSAMHRKCAGAPAAVASAGTRTRPLPSTRPAATQAATAADQTTAAAAAVAAAITGGQAAATDGAGDAAAGPPRRVRAGFQAYRPPVRSRGDDDNG